MSDQFLARFMNVALNVTTAERGMAVNSKGTVVASTNLTEQITDPDFSGFKNIEQAYLDNDAPHITNNMILDPNMAPTTNTNFANLHMVVVFPLEGIGAIYIDQHVRKGVVPPHIATRIMNMAQSIVKQGRLDATEDEMTALYEETV